jgi:PilZ domain
MLRTIRTKTPFRQRADMSAPNRGTENSAFDAAGQVWGEKSAAEHAVWYERKAVMASDTLARKWRANGTRIACRQCSESKAVNSIFHPPVRFSFILCASPRPNLHRSFMKNFAAPLPPENQRSQHPERREFPRYTLGAPAEVRDPAAKTRAAGHVTTISKKGCFLKAPKRFEPAAVVQLHIQKGDTAFETWAKVVQNLPEMGEGMALLFMGTAPEQERLLHQWIDELAATSHQSSSPC